MRTVHGSLKWLLNFKNLKGQIARWFEFLSYYNFKVEHRARYLHKHADALSCSPCFCENQYCKHSRRAEDKFEPTKSVNGHVKQFLCDSVTDISKIYSVQTRSKMGSTQDMLNPTEPLTEMQNPELKYSEFENKIKPLPSNDPGVNEIVK